MATLRSRIAGRDRELFVARESELAYFESVLGGEVETRVVHLSGIGGIGKSALLREVARRAEERGFDTVWIDGRDLPPFPGEVDAALRSITEASPALVVFDSYELIASLDSHLRDNVIPELPESTVVVFASRQQPSRGWYEQGWDTIVHSIELGGLTAADADQLVRGHGADPDDVGEIVRRSLGSPLALVVGAETGPTGSLADIAERLLGDEVEPAHYRVLSVAAIARVTTPDLLDEVLHDGDPYDSYKWLAARTFSEPLATGVTLHALVAEAVRERIRANDPTGEAALRRAIADHLHRRAIAGQFGLSLELQHLVVDPAVRWGYASDIGNRYRIDIARPGDTDAIGAVFDAIGFKPWWSVSERFFERHPEVTGVARNRDGGVGGYFVAVTPATAPAMADDDPLLGPWLTHARTVLGTNSAVLWREAVDITGEMGEITSLLGAGGLVASGVANPRYLYLPIAPEVPAARVFVERLGGQHLSQLDVHADGFDLQCYLVDFGPNGLIGFQRDWIYRESGAVPPVDLPEIDPSRLVRLLREPADLSHGPTWLGNTPSDRLVNLRGRVTAALNVFGPHRDDQLARAIVVAAYLGDSAPHETIARQLHLSRSAYFRRLQAATQRVGEQVLATAHHDR